MDLIIDSASVITNSPVNGLLILQIALSSVPSILNLGIAFKELFLTFSNDSGVILNLTGVNFGGALFYIKVI